MEAFYLFIIVALFILAISDLVVGVSNDAVNFLNSAVGSKAAQFRTVLVVAALGIIFGCAFSSGMMEVARKGIFHPGNFYFSEIMLLFLAVMVTDVVLLDAFNTLGLPTSTTISLVFGLLGASVAIATIKIYTTPNALGLGEYINSEKALAIISAIMVSVIVAFTAGVIIQYLTRLLFSFDYQKRLKYFGSLWGGLAIAGITYFILVKGAKGASFINDDMQAWIDSNTFTIIAGSFLGWALILQVLTLLTKVDILKLIVLVGTFALAMAFASNDLVNFIGVPLAGYNSYEIFKASGGTGADQLLMTGLAGKIPTPIIFLLLSGIVMTITLWTSKKARTVIKTSVDLARQYEGAERFDSYAISRSLVRSFSKMATFVNDSLPAGLKKRVEQQFDERPFAARQAHLGAEAPAFDMVRAAVTLVVSSSVIAMGTSLKLPLSTTYVTFMVFMGTSLADGAWGRESAVYRVSGVLSVISGWFFTAFSAFSIAFIIAGIFYFGGPIAIVGVLIAAGILMYRTHRYHGKKVAEENEFERAVVEGVLSKEQVIDMSVKNLNEILGGISDVIDDTLKGLVKEVILNKLTAAFKRSKSLQEQTVKLKYNANKALDQIADDEIETGHLYILVVEYLWEMANHTSNIIKPSLNHIDNHHKPLLAAQVKELKEINDLLTQYMKEVIKVFKSLDDKEANHLIPEINPVFKMIRSVRKRQIKRIKNRDIGTRNSILYLNHLGELRNLALFANRLVTVCHDLLINPDEEE